MSKMSDMKDESDSVRWQIVLRTTLLFGEERAIANRDEIDAAAGAIHRILWLHPKEFASLDAESRQ